MMSLLFGADAEDSKPKTGKAVFKQKDANFIKETIYGVAPPGTLDANMKQGRRPVPGASHVAECPWATGGAADSEPPRQVKNSKWDAGAQKVGKGGFDAEATKAGYQSSHLAAMAQKKRNQSGGGNILAFSDE